MNTDKCIETIDGQKFWYAEYGDKNGLPVFYFHGSPGCRFEAARCNDQAKSLGLRIVALDRPGLGRTPWTGKYSLLDHARSILDIADKLEWESFFAAGLSGGATTLYSLAFIAKERLRMGVDLTGWAPVSENPELAKLMAPLDRIYLRIARYAPWTFRMTFSLIEWASKKEKRLIRAVKSSLSHADRMWLENPVNARSFHESIAESFRQGISGPAHDAYLRYRPWGFRLKEIASPICIFSGTDDKFVPLEFAQWKHDQLVNSSLEPYQSWGHLRFLDNIAGLVSRAITPVVRS